MPTTYTPNVAFAMMAMNTPNWNVVVNANLALLDSLAPVGGLACRASEIPSASLNVAVAAGQFRKPDGTLGSLSGSTVTCGASTTTYIYVNSSFALASSTSGWPGSGVYVPIAVVVSGASTITTITDARVSIDAVGAGTGYLSASGGTLSDGANLAVGSTSGTQVATATTQKLGFYGATPIVQPSGSDEVAIGTLTTATPSTPTVGATNASDVSGQINSNFSAIDAQFVNAQADLAAIKTLANSIRAALVALGLYKGSA